MHLRPLQVSLDPAFKPFSSPGSCQLVDLLAETGLSGKHCLRFCHSTGCRMPQLCPTCAIAHQATVPAAGTRKASARCACSASVGVAPPRAEAAKADTHTVAGNIRGLLPAGTVQAAETTLGQRTQANNILPGRSQLRQSISKSCDQHAQVTLEQHINASHIVWPAVLDTGLCLACAWTRCAVVVKYLLRVYRHKCLGSLALDAPRASLHGTKAEACVQVQNSR